MFSRKPHEIWLASSRDKSRWMFFKKKKKKEKKKKKKENRKRRNAFLLIGCISKSVFANLDSFACLHHIYSCHNKILYICVEVHLGNTCNPCLHDFQVTDLDDPNAPFAAKVRFGSHPETAVTSDYRYVHGRWQALKIILKVSCPWLWITK